MGRAQILLIEDEDRFYQALIRDAMKEQFIVIRQKSSLQLSRIMSELNPQLIIIGSELRFKKSLELCCQLRSKTSAPIFMVEDHTCTRQEIFETGANDYFQLPIDYEELLLRIKAHLFHYKNVRNQRTFVIQFEGLSINLVTQKVFYKGAYIELSSQEFKLISYLAHRPNEVYSADQLFEDIWGENSHKDSRTVLVHISNIRKKLATDHGYPPYIQTIRGVGYTLHDYYL